MPDADLYRVQELPSEPLGGGSGDKRSFNLEFIGKTPNERFPYTVANEVVSSYLGSVLGFNIPTVIPYNIDGSPLAMVLWMKPAARQQQGPPLTSKALQEFVQGHADEIHGAIILDLYLANSDRALGPERRNIAVDENDRLLLFDFGNALFYRNREHEGIVAGVERLRSVELDLRQMFDKSEKNPESYYFQLLQEPTLIDKWCQRIRQLPEYVLENAINRIPVGVEPPSADERRELFSFLDRRRTYLQQHIYANRDLFPGLSAEN